MKEKWNECIRQNKDEYGGVTNNPKSQYSKFPKVYCSSVFYFIKKKLFVWLCRVLIAAHASSVFVEACRIFGGNVHALTCDMQDLVP